MTTQKKKHASLERRDADRFQTSSELAVQLQHQFQECQLHMAVARDTALPTVLVGSEVQGAIPFWPNLSP